MKNCIASCSTRPWHCGPLLGSSALGSRKGNNMTNIKCPSCASKLLVNHGQNSTCEDCGATFFCAGNSLKTKANLALSDFTINPSVLSGTISDGTDSRVEFTPHALGAIKCPYCRVTQPVPEHGETKFCSTCSLEMTVHGNCLTVPVTLRVSDYRIK
jgi:DNA-directed RNA polymerase subunit RPC12/RpoP